MATTAQRDSYDAGLTDVAAQAIANLTTLHNDAPLAEVLTPAVTAITSALLAVAAAITKIREDSDDQVAAVTEKLGEIAFAVNAVASSVDGIG
jgi:hypothetical protein